MIDAHTHLNSDQLFPDREKHLEEFLDAGGTHLVNIWVNQIWNLRALEMSEKYAKECLTTLGIHPLETVYGDIKDENILENKIKELSDLISTNIDKIVGIWECGIDSHYEWNDEIKAIQIPLFEKQCELARTYNLPIVIHSRSNFDLSIDVLKNYTDLKIYFHCRGYSPTEIQICVDTFPHLRIWFCGNLSYPKAIDIQESFVKARECWAKIVMETDAPYLSPQSLRGSQNAPKNVTVMYDRVQEKYNVSWEVFTDAARELYNIK